MSALVLLSLLHIAGSPIPHLSSTEYLTDKVKYESLCRVLQTVEEDFKMDMYE